MSVKDDVKARSSSGEAEGKMDGRRGSGRDEPCGSAVGTEEWLSLRTIMMCVFRGGVQACSLRSYALRGGGAEVHFPRVGGRHHYLSSEDEHRQTELNEVVAVQPTPRTHT